MNGKIIVCPACETRTYDPPLDDTAPVGSVWDRVTVELCPRCRAHIAAYPALVRVARALVEWRAARAVLRDWDRWRGVVNDSDFAKHWQILDTAVIVARGKLDAALAALPADVRAEVEGGE